MSRVKKRSYNSDLRTAQTSQLRERILSAAQNCFGAKGIDKVTIAELAAEADVAPSTVYALFKSKTGILKAIIERTFFGNDYEALAERTKTARDPLELLQITASISRVIFDTEAAAIGLIRGVSGFSPELKQVETEFEEMRYMLQEARAKLLVRVSPVARRMGVAKVRDVMWTLTGRDIYRMLVIERGWTSDEYETWLRTSLAHLLIPSSGDAR